VRFGLFLCNESLASWFTQKHDLVTNCPTYGKINCRLEDLTPCPYCGVLVEFKEQQVRRMHQTGDRHARVSSLSAKFRQERMTLLERGTLNRLNHRFFR
jgi:hypothetical protein